MSVDAVYMYHRLKLVLNVESGKLVFNPDYLLWARACLIPDEVVGVYVDLTWLFSFYSLNKDPIPLIQSIKLSNSNIIYPSVFLFVSFYDHKRHIVTSCCLPRKSLEIHCRKTIHLILNPSLWIALKKSIPTEDRGIIFPHDKLIQYEVPLFRHLTGTG